MQNTPQTSQKKATSDIQGYARLSIRTRPRIRKSTASFPACMQCLQKTIPTKHQEGGHVHALADFWKYSLSDPDDFLSLPPLNPEQAGIGNIPSDPSQAIHLPSPKGREVFFRPGGSLINPPPSSGFSQLKAFFFFPGSNTKF